MRKCEFMIGDWVTCPQETWQWKATDYMLDDSTMCNVNPIPLTEDVLKANGYDEPDKNGFMCLESSIYRIYYNIHGYFCVHVSDGKVSSECTIWLDYVHELQHALRLCGLNDLADNFKVGGKK